MRNHSNELAVLTLLLTGIIYYLGATAGVSQTVTPEGIAVLWPPNALILPAFLILPTGLWPWMAVAAITAEMLADLSAFPLPAAFAFGLINVFEVVLAAWLIRRASGVPFRFDRLRSAGTFLLFGPLLASMLAAVFGAGVYVVLGRSDTSYPGLWYLWWLGDALGLLVLTPLLVTAWRSIQAGPRWWPFPRVAEALLLWIVIAGLCMLGFHSATSGNYFTPVWLLPLSILTALRLGVMGATITVVLVSTLTVGMLVHGFQPFPMATPQRAVSLTQEYLALTTLVTVGLAILLEEIREQRTALKENERRLQMQNASLEARVAERTRALEEANRRLAATVATDELTGIASRRHFYAEATRELARLARDGLPATLIMIDLDHFKAVNDSHGHEAGDFVLRAIQNPVRLSLRPRDLQGRIGGEEFIVLLSGLTPVQALAVAERIRQSIASLDIIYRSARIKISASLGVAGWDGSSPLEDLIRHADAALYEAKNHGRNRVEVFAG